jgi:DNA polymerase-3 subunit beta
MKFVITRESLLRPLQIVSGVIERRQTLPVLSNVLLALDGSLLSITGTDLEVELIATAEVSKSGVSGSVTVPARKLLDICKSLSDDASIEVSLSESKLTVKSGRSRFVLATLPAADFPSVEEEPDTFSISVDQTRLKAILDSTSFAMAQQDVRYFLNGMLFELSSAYLRVVATDGHRLAMETLSITSDLDETKQLILPRKGVIELVKLLGEEHRVDLTFGRSHLRAKVAEFTFTSKLVDGSFPDYNRVIPKSGDKIVVGDVNYLKQGFLRASILSNEKYRGVRMVLTKGEVKILANNPEQEEAEESMSVDYDGDPLEMAFNVGYVIDVLSTVRSEQVRISLSDASSSALIEEVSGGDAVYVVMPMRL